MHAEMCKARIHASASTPNMQQHAVGSTVHGSSAAAAAAAAPAGLPPAHPLGGWRGADVPRAPAPGEPAPRGSGLSLLDPGDVCTWAAQEGSDLIPDTVADMLDLVVVLGGDGTVLWTCHMFGNRGVPPIVPVSMGSLGFLTPFQPSRLRTIMKEVNGSVNESVCT